MDGCNEGARQFQYRFSFLMVLAVAIMSTVLWWDQLWAGPAETTKSKSSKPDTNSAKQEELFQGWPKPQIALVLSGRQNGYLEPCGCSGLTNQKGGLARRFTFIDELRDKGWPVVPLDVGNLIRRYGRQSEIKFQRIVNGLESMHYEAIGLGSDDLRLPVGELLAVLADEKNHFVCANAVVVDPQFTQPMRVFKVNGKTIGVTAIIGSQEQNNVNQAEIQLSSPESALPAVVAKMKAEKCDWKILLAYASIQESRKLAQSFPEFEIVVTSGGAEEPAFEPEVVKGTSTQLVQVGGKGMYTGVLGLFADGKKIRYQRVPLDSRFRDAPEMLQLLEAYQEQLKTEGLDGLGLKPIAVDSGRTFVGSKICADCHAKAWEVFKNTTHSTATDSLIKPPERQQIARHFDPECISCHVTGWEPQAMIPFQSGFLGLEETPHLVGNGCENCHGPGSAHVSAENGTNEKQQRLLRESMRLPLSKAEQKCLECHDVDNSPAFHKKGAFEEYWQQIEHKGKD